jgi:hypothetical protein
MYNELPNLQSYFYVRIQVRLFKSLLALLRLKGVDQNIELLGGLDFVETLSTHRDPSIYLQNVATTNTGWPLEA